MDAKAETALKKLVRGYDEDLKPELVLESYEEHAIAQFALKRLVATAEDDPRFEARATALLDLIHRHVEEEEGQLLPKVERALDELTLDDLGERMEQKFDELALQGYDAILPKQPARVTADRASERVAHVDGHVR